MMGMTLGLVLSLLIPTGMNFDDRSDLETWSFSEGAEFPGARGRLHYEPNRGRGGSGGVALDFNFSKGGRYVQASFPLPDERVVAVQLSLKKTTSNRIAFRVVDADGQTFQKDLDYDFPLYQPIRVTFDSWSLHFGGKDDGVFRWPARRFAVLVNSADNARTGTLLIDDVDLITAGASPLPGRRIVSYEACFFTIAENWRSTGHPKNRMHSGRWEYTLDEAHPEAGLHREFSFHGKPQSLRLQLEDDGSGHEIAMTLTSHFQSFHRLITTLNEPGARIIDIPLGDMASWRHSGGEDDGIVRYPLRFRSITLRKKGEQATGQIPLHSIEVRTEPPPDIPVVMRPRIEHLRKNVELSLQVLNLRDEDLEGTLIAEWAGFRTLPFLREQRFWIQAGDHNRTVHVLMPPLEGPMREARFTMQLGTFPPVSASTTETELPEFIGSNELRPESPIGVGLYLYRYGGKNARKEMQRAAELARRAGVKWSREEFQWGRIEPQKGKYDFTFYDQLVDVAHENGISIYGLLGYWAPWTEPYSHQGIEDYARWAAAVVRHYKGKIRHWEIYNEPNIFFWKGPKDLYADLLTTTYDAIKRETPDAIVLGCSTAGIDTKFIARTIQRGGKFDILTIHPYRRTLDEDLFINELRQVRQRVDDRPVWITEMGWPTMLGGKISERVQATLLARTYITALASGAVRNISWYDFREDGIDPFYNEAHFGIVRRNLAPKPAYRALSTVARFLGDATPDAPVDLGPNVKAYRFAGHDRSIVAIWTKTHRDITLQASVPLKCYDLMGRTISTHDVNARIHLAEPVNTPVFLVADESFRIKRLASPAVLTIQPSIARGGTELTLQLPAEYTLQQWILPPWLAPPRPEQNNTWKLRLPERIPRGKHPIIAQVRAPDGASFRLVTPVHLAPAMIYR